MEGQKEHRNGLTAVQSLKAQMQEIVPHLPDNWRAKMREFDPFYSSAKGDRRLDNLKGGGSAPTLEELKWLKQISGVS